MTRRLSQGHVLLQRPGRRGLSSVLQQAQDEVELYPATAVHIPSDRIPSLSRSEVSVTDTSGGASTPEGPMRVLRVDTSIQVDQTYDSEEVGPTVEYDDVQATESMVAESTVAQTPGIARGRSISDDSHNRTGPRSTPLVDITASASNIPFTPYTPAASYKGSDFSTPRAALDDAERRKNHVLAVLSSTAPTRVMRSIRGTPHPLRRASVAPHSESIAEEGSSSASQHVSVDESFVSIASSADLTSDRRASHLPKHLSRGNTSFPNILLPTSGPSPGGSLRDGVADNRVNGAKLHKHLNAMNQQLLQENGELAREANAWRDEVERLRQALQEAGVDISTMLPNFEHSIDRSIASANSFLKSDKHTSVTPDDQDLGSASAMQEMAERLGALEEGLEEKDRIIADLEAELANNDLAGRLKADREELQADFASRTDQHAQKFGEICSAFEEQIRKLEQELKDVREQKGRPENLASSGSREEKDVEWRTQVSDLELALQAKQGEVIEQTNAVQKMTKELDEALRSLQQAGERAIEAENQMGQMEAQIKSARTVEKDLDDLRAKVANAEALRSAAQGEAEQSAQQVLNIQQASSDQAAELDRQYEEIQRMSARIEELEQEFEGNDFEAQLQAANDALAEREEDLEELRAKLDRSVRDQDLPDDSLINGLEQRLDEAHREIGRLKHDLAATPHRKTAIDVKDARIKALEREKAVLQDRLAINKSPHAGSPFQATPFARRTITSLRTPKTPGPLRDVSTGD